MKKWFLAILLLVCAVFASAQTAETQLEKPVWTNPLIGGGVYTAHLNSDGSLALTGGSDGLLRIWDAKSGKIVRTIDTKKVIYNAYFQMMAQQ